jgi:hypothetical protein
MNFLASEVSGLDAGGVRVTVGGITVWIWHA